MGAVQIRIEIQPSPGVHFLVASEPIGHSSERTIMTVPVVAARRYLQPLREGGSLPAVVETSDGLYVVKFRGAGQGPRALIAELIVALIGRELGLPVPDPAEVQVPPGFAQDEGDPEIRELVEASYGSNIGLRYLDGAFNFDEQAAGNLIPEELAAEIVWLDAYLTNPDRTARNPNLMIWNRRPWLIDHGSALYAHHDWRSVDEIRTRARFPLIQDHVLLRGAGDLSAADIRLADSLTTGRITELLEAVPESLLMDPLARGSFTSAEEARGRYVRYLSERLEMPRDFVEEAIAAQERRRAEPPRRLKIRR